MGISALGAGLSGLNANQQALAVEAHNVANMNTEGFEAQAATFQESPGGSGVTLSAAGLNMARAEGGTDLATSMTNSLMYKAGFEMSLKVIQAADERMGMLIDIKA
jgi:flagellar hook protein FlgE